MRGNLAKAQVRERALVPEEALLSEAVNSISLSRVGEEDHIIMPTKINRDFAKKGKTEAALGINCSA